MSYFRRHFGRRRAQGAPTFFNPAWNLARVTVRGETAALECIEARATTVGFFLRFR